VTIGYVVAVVMTLGFVLLAMTSLAAAFIPECPFYSPFSATIKVVFKFLRKIFPVRRRARFGCAIAFCVATGAAVAYGTLQYSGNILTLVFIPLSVTFSYALEDKEDEIKKDEAKRQRNRKNGAKKHEDEAEKKEEECRKPQRYRLPHFALVGFIIIGSILSAAGYFTSSRKIFVILYCVGMSLLFFVGVAARGLAKSSKKTGVIDAIAWLLNSKSTPSEIEPLVKKIGNITMDNDNDGYNHYRARLLESLMPLLSSLITSPRTKTLYDGSQPNDLETYVSCLAMLSDFKDDPFFRWKSLCHLGKDAKSMCLLREDANSVWHLREDAKSHPILEESLRQNLVELIKNSRSDKLRDVAGLVLRNFGFNENGENLLRSMQDIEIPEPLQDFEESGDASSTTTIVEPLAEHYEMKWKGQSRRKKGYNMLNVV
jgi:hypothetical protein